MTGEKTQSSSQAAGTASAYQYNYMNSIKDFLPGMLQKLLLSPA
ncbi:hypothetical protein [Sporomusa termitida]|nr:hypothetical protein [Sporomusa termitida]